MAERDRAAAGGGTVVPLDPYAVFATVSYGANAEMSGWFGPMTPLAPVAPEDVRGRHWDYPFAYNTNIRPRAYERIGFEELRALADNYDLLRMVIETRKDQVERLKWTISPKGDEYKTGRKQAPAALTNRAKALEDKLKKPDGVMAWSPWVRSLLEDLFVIDAPALYRRPTRGGDLFGVEVIDGATIKPVIDNAGAIIGYQQILKGMPAVDYDLDEIIYRPRNVRSNRVYGFSPVEQIVMSVNIALRRQVWQLQYYTEGNVPDALIGVPEAWTPDQIKQFQTWWDTLFEGNTAQRRHAKFVPGGVAKTYIPTKEPELKNVFDEWLARMVCFCFSISPAPFVAQVNRATAETAQSVSLEEGLEPVLNWIKSVVDDDILDDKDLEFRWAEDTEVDPEKQQKIFTGYSDAAVMTINEVREKLGLDPSDDPAADMLMVKTATGYVPIGANTIDGKLEAQDKLGPPMLPGGGGFGGPGGGNAPPTKPGGNAPPNASEPPAAEKIAAEFYDEFVKSYEDVPRDKSGQWTAGGHHVSWGSGSAAMAHKSDAELAYLVSRANEILSNPKSGKKAKEQAVRVRSDALKEIGHRAHKTVGGDNAAPSAGDGRTLVRAQGQKFFATLDPKGVSGRGRGGGGASPQAS